MTISLLYNGLDQNTFKFLLSTDNLNIKSFIPYTGCLLRHILHTNSLTNNEKLFYLVADSLSLIRNNTEDKQRSIALSSTIWAKKLGCSKTEIFSLQKNLEEKGYFIIIRDTNKSGKNKRNIIIPTIPDSVFYSLSKEQDRFNSTYEDRPNLSMLTPISKTTTTSVLYEHTKKRIYLDKTKLFIPINYQILSLVVASSKLSSFSKIAWLDFYSKCYMNHRKSKSYNCDKHLNDYFAFTCSYNELEQQYNCSKTLVSKTIKSLEELGFIKRSHFHVKNDNEDDNLHDKSLWNIVVTLPTEYNQQFIEQKAETYDVEQDDISVYDPYIANSDQLYNKDFISNNKDLDNIDPYQNFSDSSVNSSDLSVFLKNNSNSVRDTLNSQVKYKSIVANSDKIILTNILLAQIINLYQNNLLTYLKKKNIAKI